MATTNITDAALTRVGITKGEALPGYAWPGGYPMYYLDAENNVLCVKCANDNDDYNAAITGADVNWEDANLHCDHCSERIESAYAD